MKSLFITQAQKEALLDAFLRHVVADELGVVYAAFSSGESARKYAEHVGDVNGSLTAPHFLADCSADQVSA